MRLDLFDHESMSRRPRWGISLACQIMVCIVLSILGIILQHNLTILELFGVEFCQWFHLRIYQQAGWLCLWVGLLTDKAIWINKSSHVNAASHHASHHAKNSVIISRHHVNHSDVICTVKARNQLVNRNHLACSTVKAKIIPTSSLFINSKNKSSSIPVLQQYRTQSFNSPFLSL